MKKCPITVVPRHAIVSSGMKADWVGVIEAISSDDKAQDVWARRVIDAVRPFFPGAHLAFCSVEHMPNDAAFTVPFVAADAPFSNIADQVAVLQALDEDTFRALYYPPQIVLRLSDVMKHVAQRALLTEYLRGLGLADGVGIIVHPKPEVSTVLSAALPHASTIDRAKRRLLEQIGLHIEAKVRLRSRPDTIRAVVSADGRVIHHSSGAPEQAELARHVTDVERARSRKARKTADAVSLWRALVAGTSSFVERIEGSRRFYVVVDNPPARSSLRCLTTGEMDVVSYAARGLPSKLVAYALGLAEPTVSARLASAARKMGVASRMELVRLAALLTQDPRASFDAANLTTAEREIVDLLGAGLTNCEIAAMRGRSSRTVAHQVSRLLEKTRSGSRRALVARASTNAQS